MSGQPASLWRHGDFLKLWSAQTVSGFGARAAREGLPMTAVLLLKAPPQAMGALAALGLAAYGLGGLVAGGMADRLPRRALLISADLGRAVVMLVVPAIAIWGHLTLAELGLALALMSGLTVIFDVADHAYLPSVVARAQLVDGNAKLAATDSIAEVGGPAIAGLLFQWLTAPIAVAVSAVTYVASALLLLAIPSRPDVADSEAAPAEPASLHPLAGLRIVWANPVVRPIWLMAVAGDFFGWFFGALYLIYALDVLKLSTTLLGLTIAAGGVGGLVGAAVAPIATRRLGAGRAAVTGAFLGGLAAFLIPLAPASPLMAMGFLVAAQLVGDGLRTMTEIGLSSLRQTLIAGPELGRAGGAFAAGRGLTGVAGALLGGALGASLGPRETLLIAAAGMTAVAVLGRLSPLWRAQTPAV
jgi:predicted MFS family arabinose efflux permease